MQPELGIRFCELNTPAEEVDSPAWYLDLSHQIRTRLFIDQFKNPAVPELSQISGVTELLDHISGVAEVMWEGAMGEVMDSSFSHYSPKSHAGRKFLDSLSDKATLFKALSNNRNWQFESLRKQGDPEIWYGLVLALSEREQLKARLLEEWAAGMTPEDETKWGISKLELQIFAGLNLELQPNIDQVYVKQMRISDSGLPWSKNPPQYASIAGSASLYIIQEEGEEKVYTFQDVFPEETHNMAKAFAKYGSLIARGVADHSLSAAYQDLPDYLSRLAASFHIGKESSSIGASSETHDSVNFKAIYEAGKTDEKMCAALALAGCPIIVNPSGFVSEAGERIDMEMMVGLMIGDKSAWYQESRNLSDITADLFTKRGLSPDGLVPLLHQKFLAVNGSNITYTSLASAGDYINFNDGRHLEVGRDRHSRYHNLVKNGMSEERFIQAIVIGTMTHEYGHLLMYLDDTVNEKMGASIHIDKLEELKADTVGTIIFQDLLNRGESPITAEEYLEQFLLNYLDDILDAPDPTIDKSPVWYAFDIKAMMLHLFEANAITFTNGKFEVLDGKAGVAALAALGSQILDYYQDPSFGPSQVKDFVDQMEHKIAHHPQLQEFLLLFHTLYA
jgi:hypothetical protein